MTNEKKYGFDIKGSPMDSGEDDVWTGSDGCPYNSIEEAKKAAEEVCERPFMRRGAGALHVIITTPGESDYMKNAGVSPLMGYRGETLEVVEEYCYREADLKRQEAEARAERQEMAMQHGMAFGCRGYNQFYGEITDPPEDY